VRKIGEHVAVELVEVEANGPIAGLVEDDGANGVRPRGPSTTS
jgi:hypothetical protein